MLFTYRGNFHLQTIVMNYSEIRKSDYIKYLGIHLDSNFSFNIHIDAVCLKISRRNGVWVRISELGNMRKLLYHSRLVN